MLVEQRIISAYRILGQQYTLEITTWHRTFATNNSKISHKDAKYDSFLIYAAQRMMKSIRYSNTGFIHCRIFRQQEKRRFASKIASNSCSSVAFALWLFYPRLSCVSAREYTSDWVFAVLSAASRYIYFQSQWTFQPNSCTLWCQIVTRKRIVALTASD